VVNGRSEEYEVHGWLDYVATPAEA
jgi:hypothetical protein